MDEQTEKNKRNSHFLNLFSMAISDSNVSPQEIELIYKIGVQNGVPKEQIDYLIDNPHKVKYFKPETIDEVVEQLVDLGRLILADKRIDVREISFFRSVTQNLDIPHDKSENLLSVLIDGLKTGEQTESLSAKIEQILSTISA